MWFDTLFDSLRRLIGRFAGFVAKFFGAGSRRAGEWRCPQYEHLFMKSAFSCDLCDLRLRSPTFQPLHHMAHNGSPAAPLGGNCGSACRVDKLWAVIASGARQSRVWRRFGATYFRQIDGNRGTPACTIIVQPCAEMPGKFPTSFKSLARHLHPIKAS